MADEGAGVWHFALGADRCPECGEEAVETRRPGLWPRLHTWLMFGRPGIPGRSVCASGHEWARGTYGVLRLRSRTGYRRLTLPGGLLRTIIAHRTAQPVPIIYVLAGVVGLAVGVALDLLLDWRWWLVAPALVALVWVIYLSTALWGPYRVRLVDLLSVIDPDKAEERVHRRLDDAVAEGRWAAYGVDGWRGPVILSSWGRSPSEGLTLDHGERDGEAWIAVTTRSGEGSPLPDEVRRFHLFAELLSDERPRWEEPDLGAAVRWRAEMDRRLAEPPPWEPVTMSVDGVEIRGEKVSVGGRWAAVLDLEETTIEVRAKGGAPGSVRLFRVTSLEPYLEGLRALRRRPERGADDPGP